MRSLFISFLFLQFFCACTNNNQQTSSDDDIGTARNFIDAALQGDYDKARKFMIQDSVNNQYLDAFEHNYKDRMSREDKKGYKEASINIHNVNTLNDSVTVVQYSNSFKKQNDSLKVMRNNNTWLVDLKYSFAQTDSLP
jgi:type IV secretory pathway component VirB8